MRHIAGRIIAVAGVLIALAGVALCVYVGPDGRRITGPHEIDTQGFAVVTSPKVLSWTGITIGVLAELPADKPVFVGLGNAVDVEDYLKETEHLRVESVALSQWELDTRQVEGEAGLPAAPTALDWWVESSAGLGGASINTVLPDETVQLAITSVGDADLSGLAVTVSYQLAGGFFIGLGFIPLGAGIAVLGRMLYRDQELLHYVEDVEDVEEGDEEVTYVLVDEDGNETEISADEAAGYDVVDADDEPLLVGEVPDSEEQVVYVLIDEDGNEVEISAEEAAGYDVVDEEVALQVADEPEADDAGQGTS